ILDDVIVGDDIAIRAYDDARAQSTGTKLLRIAVAEWSAKKVLKGGAFKRIAHGLSLNHALRTDLHDRRINGTRHGSEGVLQLKCGSARIHLRGSCAAFPANDLLHIEDAGANRREQDA